MRTTIEKLILIFTLNVLFTLNIYSQISQGGIPLSYYHRLKKTTEIPEKKLKALNIRELLMNDSLQNIQNKFAEIEKIEVDIKSDGIKTKLSDGSTIWQYKITCINAISIGIGFHYFQIPEGAKLYIYNSNYSKILGAYTSINNKNDGSFYIEPLDDNKVIIEYYEPLQVNYSGVLVLGNISKGYKNFDNYLTYNDINCSEWLPYQTIKRSVCRIIFNEEDGSYYCTGSLINNTRFDGTPYFLTANHCINNPLAASSVIVYFNYESDTCNGIVTNKNQTLSGSTLLAHSSYTDFSLIQLQEKPPISYKPFFAGWDIRGNNPPSSTVIHHPKGLKKSIAISTLIGKLYPFSINWDDGSNSPPRSHWEISFTNGNTNSGSSGSPLFDQNLRIIGQLHGGDNVTNYYGAISVSWKNGLTSNTQLQPWLDPDNTGLTYIDGISGNEKPISNFAIFPQKACPFGTVKLIDSSKNYPTQWYWKISPNTFEYMPDEYGNITDSNTQHLNVKFLNRGMYSITLITKNNFGSDTLNKTIEVGDIHIQFTEYPLNKTFCKYEFQDVLFSVNDFYQLTYQYDTSLITSKQISNNIWLSLKNTETYDNSITTKVKVIAEHGYCIAQDSILLNILSPPNDDIDHALPLHYGLNGPYLNECASIQPNEPRPIAGGCLVKNNWCYDDENPSINLNNTLWFYFYAPNTGKLNIETYGYDTRLAIYEAESPRDIVNNHYKIIAANDNTPWGNEASIYDIDLYQGKKYWLQVDGFKRATGQLTIKMFSNTLQVYPNPAKEKIQVIISTKNTISGTLKLISILGKIITEQFVTVTPNSNQFSFSVSSLTSGIYLIIFQNQEIFYREKITVIKPQ